MYPHERTLRFPFFENLALRKPRGRVAMMRFASNILVYPRVWGRQPTAKLLLQLITYKKFSLYILRVTSGDHLYERSILFTLTASSCMRTSGKSQM